MDHAATFGSCAGVGQPPSCATPQIPSYTGDTPNSWEYLARGCVLELYMIYYNTCRCFWLFESDCTQLCKYIHIFVKFGPRQYEKRDVS